MFNGVYSGRRVLVTGHTGFKGSWLCEWLLGLGAEVAGYSLYIPSEPSNFEVLKLGERMKDVRGDVRDLDALTRAIADFQPEIVFHLAAQPLVRASYDEPKLTFDTNLGGTVNFLEAVRRAPSVLVGVVITSDKCYENVEWEFGYREHDRLGGKDPYSASKACAEIAFSAYWRSFFSSSEKRLATTRAGNVIGGGDWARDRIVPDCIRAWSAQREVVIRNPQATRPWQHVLEPLSGYLWLAAGLLQARPGLAGEAFNFGPDAAMNRPVSRLIEEMARTWTAGSFRIEPAATAAREAGLLKLCGDLALGRLGWHATLSFEEAVQFTAAWYLDFYHHTDAAKYGATQIAAYQELATVRGLPWTQ
jgi:CDP-glucose 4,6-dehydratase